MVQVLMAGSIRTFAVCPYFSPPPTPEDRGRRQLTTNPVLLEVCSVKGRLFWFSLYISMALIVIHGMS